MQLCFSTLACPNWTLPQIVGAAAAHKLGVDFRGVGAEIDITRLSSFTSEVDSTLELLAAHQIAVPCLATSVTLVAPAAERWQMMLEECHRYAVVAAKTNTRFLRIFGGGVPKGMNFEEARSMAQRHLRQLVKITSPHNCMPLIETHDDWSTSPRVLDLLGEFSPEDVGVLWDLEHPYNHGEAPSKTAELLKPFLRHIHIKDGKREGEKSLPRLLGEGELPLVELIGAVREAGYEDWICLETEKRWHPTVAPEPEESLPQFVRFMQKQWPRP